MNYFLKQDKKNKHLKIFIYCKMGMLFSRVWGKLFASNKEYKIIIVGLAGAGKTTMLYQL